MLIRFWRSENRLANTFALFVFAACVSGFSLIDDPQPVGAEPTAVKTALAIPLPILAAAPAQTVAVASNSVEGSVTELPSPTGSASTLSIADANKLTGRWAMNMHVLILQRGMEKFARVPFYRAKLFKQELVNGSLLEGQDIDLKMGHAPFSVYMKWRSGDKGRQAIYVDGQHDNKLLVQPGGVTGRLSGTLKIDPKGDLAMNESRHPVTKIGLVELAKEIYEVQSGNLQDATPFQCELTEDASFEDRPCFRFMVEYPSASVSKSYRKSEILIDKEFSMPVCVRNFGWGEEGKPASDDETLIEHYAYSEIDASEELTENDFDPKNKKYYMRIK
jgi:hypothetical protein